MKHHTNGRARTVQSTFHEIERERTTAVAVIHRVLLRAAELNWEGKAIGDLERIEQKLEGGVPKRTDFNGALNALESATGKLNDIAVEISTARDLDTKLPSLVSRATVVADQLARIRGSAA
jgi:hypothetical protein